MSNTSSYVKCLFYIYSLFLKYFLFQINQEEITIQNVTKKKPCISSLSYAKVEKNYQKRPFTATNTKHEIMLPLRKLPIGAIPNYMKNLKGSSKTSFVKKEIIDNSSAENVYSESHTADKLKNKSLRSFQSNIPKIKKSNLKKVTKHHILVDDETIVETKNDLLSVNSVFIAVKDFLLELKEVE